MFFRFSVVRNRALVIERPLRVLRLQRDLDEARAEPALYRDALAAAKGKGASGYHREAESTDAPERGGLPRSSDEGSVMVLERRGRVIAVELGPTGYAGRSPIVQRKAAAFVRWHEPDDARVSRPVL